MDSKQILNEFKKRFGHLKKFGLQIHGTGNLNAGTEVISISTPFIFDHRLVPKEFMGVVIRNGIEENKLPEDFQNIDEGKEYIWAYQRFEDYVDSNSGLILKTLDQTEMSKEEMLDAICFGDYNLHKQKCEQWELDGKIPKWKK